MKGLRRLLGLRGGGSGAVALRVLMVCTGNICRSPSAEGVLRAKLHAARLGERVEVDSAGTHGFHVREAPDSRACEHALRRGYDLSALRARSVVVPQDYQRFDWIFAMDGSNLEWLRRHAPQTARARIVLLLEQAMPGADTREVPDPYYGPPEGFERVLDLLEPACENLVHQFARDLPRLTPPGTGHG